MAEPTTGIETIDVHHRAQIGLVDLLQHLLTTGGDRALVDETLTRLVDFTQAHFQTEEQLMGKHAYPDREAHARAHGRLLEGVQGIVRAHASGGASGPQSAADLRGWLVDHIRGADRDFGAWCRERGIEEA
jgi:hemerythrin-like metal-binding protein